MTDDRTLIQQALLAAGKAGPFYAVSYDESGEPELGTDPISPSSCLVNETQCTFTLDSKHGMDLRWKRDAWTFLLKLQFPCEVSLVAFEELLMKTPLKIHSTDVRTTIVLYLARINTFHVPTGQPSQGTQVSIAFNTKFR